MYPMYRKFLKNFQYCVVTTVPNFYINFVFFFFYESVNNERTKYISVKYKYVFI